jgi:hypothetical protein
MFRYRDRDRDRDHDRDEMDFLLMASASDMDSTHSRLRDVSPWNAVAFSVLSLLFARSLRRHVQ